MTIVFLVAVATLTGLGAYSGTNVPIPVLVALLVTLIPTTIGGLLSAIGHRRHGPPAQGQRARHVGARGRGRRRRRYAAARQDRNDHLRQSSGDGAGLGAGRCQWHARRSGTPRQPLRRDAGGAVDRDVRARAFRRGGAPNWPGSAPRSSPFPRTRGFPASTFPDAACARARVDAILAHIGLAASAAPAAFTNAVNEIAKTGGTPLAVAETAVCSA